MNDTSNAVAQVETITPEIATEMLEVAEGFKNRRINDKRVSRYQRAMAAGTWTLSPDAIAIDPQGQLINGQHRLWAVVESGVTIQALVIRGIARSTFQNTDRGIQRSLKNDLEMSGYENTSELATMIAYIVRYESHGRIRSAGSRDPVMFSDAMDLLQRHPDIPDVLRVARSVWNPWRGISRTLIGAMWFLFDQVDLDDAETFFQKLGTGVDLASDDPIYLVREKLRRQRDQTIGRGHADPEYQAALLIKAWNLFRAGKTAKTLDFRAGGSKPEKYPEIQ